MNPNELLKSIYLGDRACKAIRIESWKKELAVQVDIISRLRPGTDTWNFYTDGDIIDGLLIFTGVKRLTFEPPGFVPNDFIHTISSKELEGSLPKLYLFEISIGSVDDEGRTTEVSMTVEASGLRLEDPEKPGVDVA